MPDSTGTNGHRDGPARSAEEIAHWLVNALAERAHIAPENVDPRAPFARFGLGSIESVVLTGELEEWLGRELSATLLWDYASIRKLSAYLGAAGAVT